MDSKIYQWLNSIQFALMPAVCVLCGDRGSRDRDLCTACEQELPRLTNACARCAEPLASRSGQSLCGRCQSKPPAFSRVHTPFIYSHPLDHLLQQLKYHGRLEMARILGGLMAETLLEQLDRIPDVLIPVPLHGRRLRERGFNQALELARPLSRRLNIPINAHACRRRKATPAQSELSRKAREKNVKGVFEAQAELQGHVAIVDDVLTTGSTAHELARCLLRAGADQVDVWVCARA